MPSLSTKLSFSPFRSSNLHTEGDRCALTSLCQQTPLLVCARVSISANAQQFLLPSLFFSSHPLSISDAVSTKDTVFSSLVYFLEEEVVVLEF